MIQYSITGVPFIQLDEDNRLIFSGTGNGTYKWLTFSGYTNGLSKIRKKKNEDIPEFGFIRKKVSFTTNVAMKGLKRRIINEVTFLNKKSRQDWGKIIEKYLNEKGEMLKENIQKFDEEINNIKLVIK